MGLFGNRRIKNLTEALDTLRMQVTVQWQSSSTEARSVAIIELLRELRAAGKADQAAAALDRVRTPQWGAFALGNNPEEARRSLERGGWRPSEGRDEKWAELMARFDNTLRGQ